jgi:two-component system, cell cycle sensor histidine kinase and response regulator CckA
VILSNASLAKEVLDPDHPIHADLDEIEKAAKRAAALTGQLLAFSRKQASKPKPVALNAVVTSVEKMLSRIVGEDIAMSAALAPALGTIDADPGQIEQLLVNLVVNARDAMPEGGRLTIETANVEIDDVHAVQLEVTPGRYVTIAVTDTGCGMDESVRARMFEPFFTTKEVGRGTGLGLAMVFGIVKQSKGGIAVTSEPGRGTTFRVYFPRTDRADTSAEMPRLFEAPRGSETVLVVEDDEQVRSVLRRYLTSWGYTLLEAPNGRIALEVARAHAGAIDLLLTDLVMPEMDGRSLSARLLADHPNTRVVLMSGYTEHAALHGTKIGPDEHFVQKPFTAQMLGETVRRALDGPATGASRDR